MVVDVQGGDGCPRFSCGHLKNISSPFRQRGDPPGCGSEYYELMCRDSKATVRISNVVYYVVDINYADWSFSVVEANLDMSSICPLPYYTSPESSSSNFDLHGLANLEVDGPWACFANCSRAITNNSLYKPVSCLGAKDSFVYVWANSNGCEIIYLEHSCGYLAMAPFHVSSIRGVHLGNASYLDIMGFINKGFSVKFPYYPNGGPMDFDQGSDNNIIKLCLSNSTRSVYIGPILN
ncbi:uncharacterized protein [Lolium perenne]|uniref:uncharacterized protein n=1 Tax=Lolium perenne TaxID=4522 RepID=UPI003A98DDB3